MRPTNHALEQQLELRRRHERRVREAIDRLGCRNMNNTKWREAFTAIHEARPAKFSVRVKLVYNKRPHFANGIRLVGHKYVDCSAGPFEHREIEWLEVAGEDKSVIRQQLQKLGELPIEEADNGFRILGYGTATVIDV